MTNWIFSVILATIFTTISISLHVSFTNFTQTFLPNLFEFFEIFVCTNVVTTRCDVPLILSLSCSTKLQGTSLRWDPQSWSTFALQDTCSPLTIVFEAWKRVCSFIEANADFVYSVVHHSNKLQKFQFGSQHMISFYSFSDIMQNCRKSFFYNKTSNNMK